jgi:hypothetical protein
MVRPAEDDRSRTTMTEIDELRSQIEDLSRRLQALEDHIAITQVVARYGPAVDSGAARVTRVSSATVAPTC